MIESTMQMIWHGFSCVELLFTATRGEVRVVVNPFNPSLANKTLKDMEADIVLQTHNASEASGMQAISGNPFLIQGPGEYEVREIFFFGLEAFRTHTPGLHTIYRIEAEGIRVAHLGGLDRLLTDQEFEFLQNIDVVIIPVGGKSVLSAAVARELIERLEPRVVIPVSHAVSGFGDDRYVPVETFLSEMGGARTEMVNKFKAQRKDLPEDELVINVLERV